MRTLRWVLLAIGAIGVAGCGATDEKPATSTQRARVAAQPGTIVAVLQPDPKNSTEDRIVSVGPNGRLGVLATMQGQPGLLPFVAVSPDGRTVAYDKLGDGLHLVTIDGTHDRLLKTPRGGGSPAYSSDGRQLAYDTAAAYPDGLHGAIYVHDLATGRARRLTPRGQNQDQLPAWLSDGRIVFQRDDGATTHFDVWVMDADGSHRRQITRNPDGEFRPLPSPDGRSIAVTVYHQSQHGTDIKAIEVVDLNGRVVHSFAGGDTADAWSPDATQLLVDGTRGVPAAERAGSEDFGLWLQPIDGSAPRTLADPAGRATLQLGAWSPGG